VTPSIRVLLSQIATFEQQHRAGITPSWFALAEFFAAAREVQAEVDALDRGLTPPPAAPRVGRTTSMDGFALEGVDDAVSVRVDVPIGRVARALLVALGRADGDPARVIGA